MFKTIEAAFWGGIGFILLVACFQACDDLATDPNWAAAADDPQPAAKADCQQPIIRVAAPYDLSEALADAEALTQGAVRFRQVSRDPDLTIHDDPGLRDRGNWGEATYRGREIWLDFAQIPADWLGRIFLHEATHSAGFWNDVSRDLCDLMRTPPNWCDGRPIVRQNYIAALRRLGRCPGQPATQIAASAPPVDGADGCIREE